MPGDLRPLCRCVARAFRELAGTIDRDRKRSWLRRDIVTLLRAAAEIEETRATCPCGAPSSPAPETTRKVAHVRALLEAEPPLCPECNDTGWKVPADARLSHMKEPCPFCAKGYEIEQAERRAARGGDTP